MCGIKERDIDNWLSLCTQRREPQVRSTHRKMFVANQNARTKFRQDSEQTSGWIRAARVVADVFPERFFATVRAYDARFDDYLWH